MGRFAKGEVVLVKFPFSDLSQTKLRPALVLATVEYDDLLLCQVTSKTYGDRNAVRIETSDFESGRLPLTSYARPGRILTAADSLVVRNLAVLTESKRLEIAAAIGNLIA